MTAPQNPAAASRPWHRPGMSASDIHMWQAAERAAAEAPEIQPGDDIALAIQALFQGFAGRVRTGRAVDEQHPAA